MSVCQAMVVHVWWLKCCSFLCAMFHKRDREHLGKREPPSKRFRSNIADLFLGNQCSAQRASEIYEDADLAGAAFVEDLAKTARCGSKDPEARNRNVHRDLLRKLVKGSLWPPWYHIKARFLNPKTDKVEMMSLPMLLPHEVLHVFASKNNKERIEEISNCSAATLNHLLEMRRDHGLPNAIPCSLWQDSTPMNYDRTESLECLAMGFPGWTGSNANVRVPLMVFPKKFLAKGKTFHDIMKVVSWSFQHLLLGKFPGSQQNGQPWKDKFG